MGIIYTPVVDTREKRPWELQPAGCRGVVRKKLDAGDYSILGLEHRVAFERKGKHDFIACVRKERCRFETQLKQLAAYQYSAVIVEAAYHEFNMKWWHSAAEPRHVKNAIAAWSTWGVPILFCGSPENCADHINRTFTAIAAMVARENQHIVIQENELCTKQQSQAG